LVYELEGLDYSGTDPCLGSAVPIEKALNHLQLELVLALPHGIPVKDN